MRTTKFATMAAVFASCLLSAPQKDKGGNGATTFQEQCILCHGQDGRAETDAGKTVKAADLTAPDVQQRSDSELSKIIKNGKGKMPAFQDKLADDQIRAVIAYVRELGKKR